jgi:hypothetical protein
LRLLRLNVNLLQPLGVRRRLRASLIVRGTDIELIGQPIQTEVIPILKSLE